MMIPAAILSAQGHIKIVRLIFSEVQDGKNVCDRNLATKKSALRQEVDYGPGKDILNAEDLYDALCRFTRERPESGDLAISSKFAACTLFQKMDL
jgi:hypothetical protein